MADSGTVHLIHSKEAWEEKLKEASTDGKLIISNFAASWCRPCRSIAPHVQMLALKHPNTLFLRVDVDHMPDVGDEFDIQAMPTFVFLRNGKRIDRLVGANLHCLQQKLAHHTTS